MSHFEVYTFILCAVVFLLFTLVFSLTIAEMTQMKLKLIRHGLEDEAILKEHKKSTCKSRVLIVLGKALSLLLCLVLCVAFGFSVYMNATEEKAPNGIPSLKVVKSASMSEKHESNTWLFEHGLDDQIQTFDIIVTRHLPPEEELQLYDIVVYKQDDILIIHRIVGIEKPNEDHPDEYHFLLQGDASENPDRYPVLYSQMQGIYKGERIPFVGSFVLFLQAPAGWLCILLVLIAMVATPLVERKLQRAICIRLQLLEARTRKEAPQSEAEAQEQTDPADA